MFIARHLQWFRLLNRTISEVDRKRRVAQARSASRTSRKSSRLALVYRVLFSTSLIRLCSAGFIYALCIFKFPKNKRSSHMLANARRIIESESPYRALYVNPSLSCLLDMVESSSADVTRTLRGCFRGEFVYISFCLVLQRKKTSNAGGMPYFRQNETIRNINNSIWKTSTQRASNLHRGTLYHV